MRVTRTPERKTRKNVLGQHRKACCRSPPRASRVGTQRDETHSVLDEKRPAARVARGAGALRVSQVADYIGGFSSLAAALAAALASTIASAAIATTAAVPAAPIAAAIASALAAPLAAPAIAAS